MKVILAAIASLAALSGAAMAQGLPADIEAAIEEVTPRMIAWRRDFHEHPELGNRETRTAQRVAAHLRALRLDEVRTGVAHTGVVGILRGGLPGPTIALRADMDALPVTEQVDLPFRSRARTTFNGGEVGVMHACGHDTHTAILMAAAEVLARRRATLRGAIIFIFQPAEEGAPQGERGGAEMMLEEGIFEGLRPDAVFGLHTWTVPGGTVISAPGALMASADEMRIIVHGRQTHAARPHQGIDPVTVAAQIVTALQLIPTRQFDAVHSPIVISIGQIRGGVRFNIIPDDVELWGTVRVLDAEAHPRVLEAIRRTAQDIAQSAGATAEVQFNGVSYPVLVNDPALTAQSMDALRNVLGPQNVQQAQPLMVSEDFSFFSNEAPGFFFFYGVNAPGATNAAPNHSPNFYVHEPTMTTGLRGLLAVTLARMEAGAPAAAGAP